ncbi:WASH complex subunit 3 [Ischnura elegans]|uniref:WASH complex subunit 3 n=1 Tax=Ischnura elegans TaxID=197161 RepID=UPI001ED88149|nr:WASH complex subunit 3 [Ischnura elegans]
MDVDGLPILGPGVNYTEIRPIDHKRTLALINHFVTNTVCFLNKFSRSCEAKLGKFEDKIQKLEASLSILEAKLSSVPGLTVETSPTPVEEKNSENTAQKETLPPVETVKDSESVDPAPPPVPPQEAVSVNTGPTVRQDPRYAKFFKMVHFGVPPQAVKLKMEQEGLDPNYLDNPDMPAPENFSAPQENSNTDEDSSDNSSSD